MREIQSALRDLRFGAVEITVHNAQVVQIERKEKFRLQVELLKLQAWVKETGWYPDTCVVGLAEGLKNKDLAVKFIEENILED